MRIMIVGAGGLLGCACTRAFMLRDEVAPLTRAQLDICDAAAVYDALARHRPEWVVNAAGMSDADACEKQPAQAFAVNAAAPAALARLCTRFGARLLHVSADDVFDGEKAAPYHEWDKPRPINIYGQSKLLGEEAVLAAPKPLVVRTQWLYGESRPGFIGQVLDAALKGDTVYGAEDRVGSPTYAPDLAALLAKLVHINAEGIFHAANQGSASRYTLAGDVLRIAGFNTGVQAVTSDFFPDAAPRPRYSVLQGLRMNSCGITSLRPYQEAIAAFIGEYVKSLACT